MLIQRSEFAALIPHADAMCLLDSVSYWDAEQIVCHSVSHWQPDNPLRRNGRLSALHVCEYGAQAMAVHGALLARERGESLAAGFLAALREVQLHVDNLADIGASLRIEARRLFAAGDNLIYDFHASADSRPIAAGRATVMTQGVQV